MLHLPDQRQVLLRPLGQDRGDRLRMPRIEVRHRPVDIGRELREPLLQERVVLAAREVGDAGQRHVDSVEHGAFVVGGADPRSEAVVVGVGRAGRRGGEAAVLRLLEAESLPRDLLEGACQQRVVVALGDHDARGQHPVDPLAADIVFEAKGIGLVVGVVPDLVVADGEGGHAGVVLQRLPRPQPFADLVREHVRIAGVLERLLRRLPRYLMLPVAVGGSAQEHGRDHQGPDHPHHANDVGQHPLMRPLPHGFLLRLGEAEVDHAGEVLVDAVPPAGGQKLVGAVQPERLPVVRVHQILARFAAVQREQAHAGALSARLVGEQSAVLVVGMGDDHQ